jgi:hypothetical protein
MQMPAIRIVLLAFTCSLVYSQTADKPLTFDAASVKPAVPPTPNGRGMIMMQGPSGGPGTKDPGRIHYPNMSMKNILMNAYDVKIFKSWAQPGWIRKGSISLPPCRRTPLRNSSAPCCRTCLRSGSS